MKKNTKSPKVPNVKGKAKEKKNIKKTKFWISKPGGKIPYQIVPSKLNEWLKLQGYSLITSFGTNQIVKLENYIAFPKEPMEVFTDALNYVQEQKNQSLEDCFMIQGESLLVSKKGTLGALQKLTLKKYSDSLDVVRVFYKNTVVEISNKGIKLVSYKCLEAMDCYIMSEQVIDRDFVLKEKTKGDFKVFLDKITNSDKHLLSVSTAIGYIISSYKNPSQAKAVIITDILSQVMNEAYGRSGKGIIIKALSFIINVVEYNGKVTDLANDKFVFQNVNLTTALIVLQDVTKGFVFESLFSTLTDNMGIERKYQSKTNIPFSTSPKIALTTNYTIPQDTDSFKDRKHMVMLNNYFNAKNKPDKYFKSLLFNWKKKEWQRFDNFMMKCVLLFLEHGLIKYSDEKFERQRLINQTSIVFVELMESEYNFFNKYFSIKKIAKNLEVGIEEPSAKSRLIGKWIDDFASHKGFQIDKRISGGITKLCFRPPPG